MPNTDIKKFVKEELQNLRNEIGNEIRKLEMFSEAYLLILLDLALTNDPCERLTRILGAISTDFPQPILEIYVKRVVSRARKADIKFEALADCLIQGLGDRVKELRLADEIVKTYGFNAGERWKATIEKSNNPKTSDCEHKALNKSQSHVMP